MFSPACLYREIKRSSILVPTIPCGTKLEALASAKGSPRYSAAMRTVSVFPTPVGPTNRIDSTSSFSSAV